MCPCQSLPPTCPHPSGKRRPSQTPARPLPPCASGVYALGQNRVTGASLAGGVAGKVGTIGVIIGFDLPLTTFLPGLTMLLT